MSTDARWETWSAWRGLRGTGGLHCPEGLSFFPLHRPLRTSQDQPSAQGKSQCPTWSGPRNENPAPYSVEGKQRSERNMTPTPQGLRTVKGELKARMRFLPPTPSPGHFAVPLPGSWGRLMAGFSPGRRCWQTPGPAAGRPPWPPQCPSSRHTLSPIRGTRSSPPAPPPGPRRGSGPRSGAAVDRKKGMVTRWGQRRAAPHIAIHLNFPNSGGPAWGTDSIQASLRVYYEPTSYPVWSYVLGPPTGILRP